MKNFKNLLLLILPIWSFNLFANDLENDEVFACAIDRFTLNSLAANIGNDYEDDELKKSIYVAIATMGSYHTYLFTTL